MNLINIETLTTDKKLTPSETYLLNFINESPDFFCHETILTIAQKNHVSPASITRLAKKVGFENLKQLQLHILYKKSLIKENYEIVDADDLKSTLKNLKTYHLFSINETFNTLDLTKIQDLVNDLLKSKRTILYGVGSSFTVSNELGLNLQKLGFDVICHQDFHQQLLNLPSLKKNDHILLFSKTGETKEIQFLIQEAFQRNIPVSIITSNADLTNQEKIKNLISFVTHEQKERITAISSKMAQFLVADFIFIEIFKNSQFKKRVPQGTTLVKNWNNQ